MTGFSKGSVTPLPSGIVLTSASSLQVPSEEEPPHPPADALSVIEDVELVHELVHGVARFGDGAQVGHEPHIIALIIKVCLELVCAEYREAVT